MTDEQTRAAVRKINRETYDPATTDERLDAIYARLQELDAERTALWEGRVAA